MFAAPRKGNTINSANDRLQERLARAIAAKNRAAATSGDSVSRTSSPITTGESPRNSLDIPSRLSEDVARGEANAHSQQESIEKEEAPRSLSNEHTNVEAAPVEQVDIATKPIPPSDVSSPSSAPEFRSSILVPTTLNEESLLSSVTQIPGITPTPRDDAEADNIINHGTSVEGSGRGSWQQSTDLDRQEESRQQEMHDYVERIDALQAKLQYLSREATESARRIAAAAPSGSGERRLAEKDEQIALLMEEGQKLSKTEMKHLTVIKKLRIQAQLSEKESMEARKRAEKFEKEKSLFAERLRRIDTIEKQAGEHQKVLTQLQKDLQSVTAERDASNELITLLNAQLEEAASQASADEAKAIQSQLDVERSKTVDLENDLSSLKIEKELMAGRAKAQIDELRAKAEREAERARAVEVEMRAEQQMLESRLELLRTRAEEVSSGATGDAQAKLLRQIETLQSQYSIASENWQRIEASLSSRAANLEIERDEALRKETETRRKARDMVRTHAIIRVVYGAHHQDRMRSPSESKTTSKATGHKSPQ